MGNLYISWYEQLERHTVGPFLTISPDGYGFVIDQNWIAYCVQYPNATFERVIVPMHHTIYSV